MNIKSLTQSACLALLLAGTFLSCKSSRPESGAMTIEDTYWLLVEVDGIKVETPPGSRPVYMRLSRTGDQQRLTGHAGCNGLGGDFEIDGRTIRLQPITTKMFCESQMQTENAFLEMLTTADRYAIEGAYLLLYSKDTLLGRLEGSPNVPVGSRQ